MAHQREVLKQLPRNPRAGVILVLGAAAAVIAVLTMVDPWSCGIGIFHGQVDLDVYREGASRAYRGIPLYETPMFWGHLYTYTPFSAVLFMAVRSVPGFVYPRSPEGASVDYLWMGVSVALLLACVLMCWRMLGYRISRRIIAVSAAISLICCFLEPVRDTLYFGQVNIALMALVLWDFTMVTSRLRGVATGLAAGIKLTPLFFVGYLVVLRQWRAVLTSLAAFAATIVGAWCYLPGDSAEYWTRTLWRAERIGPIDHAGNQSLHGAYAHLTGEAMPLWGWVLAAGAVAIAGYALAWLLEQRDERLLAITVCGLTSTVVSPFSWFHHWVWFVPLVVYFVHRAYTSGWWWLAVLAVVLPAGSWVYWYDPFPVIGLYMLPPWWPTAPLQENVYLLVYAAVVSWLWLGQRQAAQGEPALRVDMLPADNHLEVQVGAGGIAAVAHAGDLHARRYALAGRHEEVVHVPVDGDGAIVMTDAHPQAEACGRPGIDYGAVGDRVDGGADGISDVDAGMKGAPARAEG